MQMKKRIFSVVITLMLIISIIPATVVHANDIRIIVDGQEIFFPDQRPAIVDGRTLVPVRGVFEALGFNVGWDDHARAAILSRHDYQLIIPVGSYSFTTNGATHLLDVPAQIIGDRTMLPIRFPLESVGYELDWDGNTGTVIITTINQTTHPFNTPEHAPHLATQSSITLSSYRRLTESELQEWIDEYRKMGGMSEPEHEVVRLANIERERHGLQLLVIDEALSMAARFHAQIVANADFYHYLAPGESIAGVHRLGPYGGSLSAARDIFGVQGLTAAAGPTTGFGVTPQSQIATLMNSAPHREGLLRTDNARIGVGAQIGASGRIYFYMMYAR